MTSLMKSVRLWLGGLPAPRLLLLGYFVYMAAGAALLCIPWLQSTPLAPIDAVFTAISAVSTTGLVSVDPGASFNIAGEVVLLVLIQIGGLGYMTVGSIIAVAMRRKLSLAQHHALVTGFGLPDDFNLKRFVMELAGFTLAAELAGALLLWPMFAGHGVDNALWAAVFHSISAFCTAGFSLFPTSLEAFRADPAINITVAALAYSGAIGFLVFADLWENATRRRKGLGFSTKVILVTTIIFSGAGAVILAFAEPSIATLPAGERALAAFFQAMTATTTVGFNTIPIGALASASVLLSYLLMMFGASPAGTGGGLKSTTLATMCGLVISTLRGKTEVHVLGHAVAPARIQIASASVTFYVLALLVAIFALLLTETIAFESLAFEAISALGTVGLSMGATGALSDTGKIIVMALMFVGRIGVLTFGLALLSGRTNGSKRPDLDELSF
jgi:trk system potassium uptake protein TrkH